MDTNMKVNIRKENCLILYLYNKDKPGPPCVGEQERVYSSGEAVLAGIALALIPNPIKRA